MGLETPASNTPTLQTERLMLRPLSMDDLDTLHRISNEPKVRLHLWDDEPVPEVTIRDLIAQSDRMFSSEGIACSASGCAGEKTSSASAASCASKAWMSRSSATS